SARSSPTRASPRSAAASAPPPTCTPDPGPAERSERAGSPGDDAGAHWTRARLDALRRRRGGALGAGLRAAEAAQQRLERPREGAVLPLHQELAGDEDRAIRAAGDADQQHEDERPDRRATEEQQRQQREDHGQ